MVGQEPVGVSMNSEIVVAVIIALLGAIPGILALRSKSRQVESENWEKLTKAYNDLSQTTQEDTELLSKRVESAEMTLLNQRKEYSRLHGLYTALQKDFTKAMSRIAQLEKENEQLRANNERRDRFESELKSQNDDLLNTNAKLTQQLSAGVDELLRRGECVL